MRHVVLDASFISDLHVARATAELRQRLDEVGLAELIGADHIRSTIAVAVERCRSGG